MSEGQIQLTSQLEKSHKKLGVVLIWRVGTLRTASGRRSKTSASVAARLTYQKPVKASHVEKNAGLIGLVIGRRQDERRSRGTIVKKGQLCA